MQDYKISQSEVTSYNTSNFNRKQIGSIPNEFISSKDMESKVTAKDLSEEETKIKALSYIPEDASTQKYYNVVMIVSYHGANYSGFQRQDHAKTVQGVLEKALSGIANHPVETFCAGRTDARVHGTNQVINFYTTSLRPEHGWLRGANTKLPADVRIVACWVLEDLEFHSRFSATARKYRYLILPSQGNAHLHDLVTTVSYDLDIDAMQNAAKYLIGEQDFKSFQAARCQATTSMRAIYQADFYRDGNFIVFEIEANAFLYHMVRNIMGALLMVGRGKMTGSEFKELIAKQDRRLAPPTAPANGLYLVSVTYPEPYTFIRSQLLGPSLVKG